MTIENQFGMQPQQVQQPCPVPPGKMPKRRSSIIGQLLLILGILVLVTRPVVAMNGSAAAVFNSGDTVAMILYIFFSLFFSFGFIIWGIILIVRRRKRVAAWDRYNRWMQQNQSNQQGM